MLTGRFLARLTIVTALLLSVTVYGNGSPDDHKGKADEKAKTDNEKAKEDAAKAKADKLKAKAEDNKAKFDQDRAKKLKDAGVAFNKNVETTKKFILSEYDRGIASIRSAPGLTAAARKDKLDEWTKAKKLFEDSTKFPRDDEFAGMELKYYVSVNKAFVPLAAIINQTIEIGNQTGNTELADEGQAMKTQMEKQMLGSNNFTGGSRWHGTLKRGGNTIPYHLNIGKMTPSGTFKGHVEDNPGVAGNWAYDVEGQMSGLGVEFAMTKSVRGKFTAVRVLGVVSGDRLIAEIASTTGGKAGKGLLILNRR